MAKGSGPKRWWLPHYVTLGAAEPDAQLVDGEDLLQAIVKVRGRKRLPKVKWEYVNMLLTRAEARRLAEQLLHPEG